MGQTNQTVPTLHNQNVDKHLIEHIEINGKQKSFISN